MKPYELQKNNDAAAVPRRVALVRREAPARLLQEREETMLAAPHLLVREVILLQVCVVMLAILSLRFNAPLEAVADPYRTPNPAKAPWYFLGLQELLHYFPPVVAGVLLPSLAVFGIVVIPYFRINIEITGFYERPWRRNLALVALSVFLVSMLLVAYRVWPVLVPTLFIFALMCLPASPGCPPTVKRRLSRVPMANWIMTWFVAVVVILTTIGVLFRGPGWTWVWPWREGIY